MMRGKETTRTEELRNPPASYLLQPQSICTRCGGLMVDDISMDLQDNTSELECSARRCVQCGEIIDAVILRNRSLRQQSETTQQQSTAMRQAVSLIKFH